jgi:ABC-type taurine transport system ATPase subunit
MTVAQAGTGLGMGLATTAVEIAAAEKTYPNGTRALLPVNLNVKSGEFITLLGPSGCGGCFWPTSR